VATPPGGIVPTVGDPNATTVIAQSSVPIDDPPQRAVLVDALGSLVVTAESFLASIEFGADDPDTFALRERTPTSSGLATFEGLTFVTPKGTTINVSYGVASLGLQSAALTTTVKVAGCPVG